MALVMAPSSDRSTVEGLAHLPGARGLHGALGTMEIEASGFPRETKKFDEPPALALKIGNERLVLDVQAAQRQHATPMRGEALGLANAPAAIGEIVRKYQQPGGELLEETRHADIARVAPAENDPRRRIERRNDAEHEDVVGQLVDHAVGAATQFAQPFEVRVGDTADCGLRPRRVYWAKLGGGFANVLEFARAEDARMAGGDLLDEARAGARHADDEDRQVGRVTPAIDRGEEGRGEIGNRPVDFARKVRGVETVARRRARLRGKVGSPVS